MFKGVSQCTHNVCECALLWSIWPFHYSLLSLYFPPPTFQHLLIHILISSTFTYYTILLMLYHSCLVSNYGILHFSFTKYFHEKFWTIIQKMARVCLESAYSLWTATMKCDGLRSKKPGLTYLFNKLEQFISNQFHSSSLQNLIRLPLLAVCVGLLL
jgi:hypothetical protein